MKVLLSLPQNLLGCYKDICRPEQKEYFIDSDPEGSHLGSGGGTAWILKDFKKENPSDYNDKKILIHAGGQGRRLPSYSASGKIFAPIPVYRWKCGQKIDQTLLDIQAEFYTAVMERSAENHKLLIASGDVLIRCEVLPHSLPNADVVLLTTWIDASTATHHGVVFARADNPFVPDFLLQKPNASKIESLLSSHVFMMDTGCWILSERAVNVLMKKCYGDSAACDGLPNQYDFYSEFSASLGKNPLKYDEDISPLTFECVNLEGGEFYHFGTTRELISSTEKIQSLVTDPRNILHKKVKAQGSVFVQNSNVDIAWSQEQKNIWIENSSTGKGWTLEGDNVITGVPDNKWTITLKKGQCLDVEPSLSEGYILRNYLIDDTFKGELQFEKRFPVIANSDFEACGAEIVRALFDGKEKSEIEKICNVKAWLSADDILSQSDIKKLYEQRETFLKNNLPLLAKNYSKSVFYQCDLAHTKDLYNQFDLSLPEKIQSNELGYELLMRNRMFTGDEKSAFEVLSDSIVSGVSKCDPKINLITDQIAWGRSPVRIDIAGGWSDTPPYSIYNGGSVVNFALDLNGQQPVQSYVRFIKEPLFILRSIDTGVSEKVSNWDELEAYNQIGSSFSIPKAALCLAGFGRQFSTRRFNSLKEQLVTLGGGLEITTLAAIPKGSGLGTSSIIASTLLGTLSNVCGLGWSDQEICFRTLALEQLLTTGGGWQDQFGGFYGGIKLCTSRPGIQDSVEVRRLPSNILSDSATSGLWLLYYTGITRVAKDVLGDIVRNMFLNKGDVISCADEIKELGHKMSEAVQFCDYEMVAGLIKDSWKLNKKLDSGVSTDEIESILKRIDDYSLGYKLAGAGGGGYMLICAKDLEASARIQKELKDNPLNERARFVGLSINEKGFEVTRS